MAWFRFIDILSRSERADLNSLYVDDFGGREALRMLVKEGFDRSRWSHEEDVILRGAANLGRDDDALFDMAMEAGLYLKAGFRAFLLFDVSLTLGSILS